MAKVTAPLMSVSASGTVAKLITFRQTGAGSICQLPPIPRKPPSQPQQAERARFAAALHAWRDLDQQTRDIWSARGIVFARQPVVLFASEYLLQNCQPPRLPLVPSPTGR